MGDGLERSDKGVISDPELLPVTSMTFLRDQYGEKEETEGSITLSALKCHEEGMCLGVLWCLRVCWRARVCTKSMNMQIDEGKI